MNLRIVILAGILSGVAPVFAAAPATPTLVPANFQSVTDSQGFNWSLDQNGSINGSNCFNSAFSLQVNGSSFYSQQPMMSADGSEYFLDGGNNNIAVTRRVKFDQKTACARYIDTIRNGSGSAQSVRLLWRIQFNNQMQGAITDSGVGLGTALGPKDTGFLVQPQAGQSYPAATVVLSGRGAKQRPTIQNQQNYSFSINYTVQMAPGETMSFVSVAAQRTLSSTPDAKALAKLFAPLNSPKLFADIPAKDRKTIVNFTPGGFSSGPTAPALASLFDKLNIEPGPSDVLAIGANTRLKGSASCARLEIETARGKAVVPFENVAAILGGKREARVLLRDGQALTGRLVAEGLKFTLTTGTTLTLDIANLDRLILRAQPAAATPPAWGYVETFTGDRLAVKPDSKLRLRASTAWGVCEIAPEDLVGCGPTDENPLGFRVLLKDGSHFVAFLDGEEMAFDTVLFGAKKFPIPEIRQINVTQPKPAEDRFDTPPERAQVILAGGQVLSGQIDLAELHFLSPAGVIPIASNLVRTLHNTNEDGAEAVPTFNATVWGGSAITGTLREMVVPVRAAGSVFQVPARDLIDAVVPTPAMPEGLRDKISTLIRDLGHADWEKREAASRELGELGAMASMQLGESVKQTNDAEVRRRAQSLLDSIQTL